MVALIVIGSILLFLLLVLLCPVKLSVTYQETLSLTLRYAFVKIRLLPSKTPEKASAAKEKKPKKEKKPPSEEGEKPKSFFQKLKEQHGISGLLYLGKELLKLAGSSLKGFFSHVVVYHLHGDVRIATDDAAQTAIQFGQACAVLEPCMAVLMPLVPKKKRKDVKLYVAPDFTSEVSKIGVYAEVGIRPLFVFSTVFYALFRFIAIYVRAGQRAKERKAENDGQTQPIPENPTKAV